MDEVRTWPVKKKKKKKKKKNKKKCPTKPVGQPRRKTWEKIAQASHKCPKKLPT